MFNNLPDRIKSAWHVLRGNANQGPRDRVYQVGRVMVFDYALTGESKRPAYADINAMLTRVSGFRTLADGNRWTLAYGDIAMSTADHVEQFPSEDSAVAACDLAQRSLHRALRRKLAPRRVLYACLLLVGVLFFVPAHRVKSGGVAVAAAAPMPQSSVPLLDPPSGSDASANVTSLQAASQPTATAVQVDLSRVKGMRGFDGGGKGAEIWVLVDPQCEFCQALEKELAQGIRDDTLHVHYVPVPIKGGKSAILTAEVLCNDSPLQAWGNAMYTGSVSTDISNKPKLTVCANDTMKNLKTFIDLKMSGTPTIVAANGLATTGVMPIDQLVRWAKDNS